MIGLHRAGQPPHENRGEHVLQVLPGQRRQAHIGLFFAEQPSEPHDVGDVVRTEPHLPDARIKKAGILRAVRIDHECDFVPPLPQPRPQLREEALRTAAGERGEIEQKSEGSG